MDGPVQGGAVRKQGAPEVGDTVSLPTSLDLRRDLEVLRRVALDAVEPTRAVSRHLFRDGNALRVLGHEATIPFERVLICAAGKAAVPMAAAAIRVLGDDLVAQHRLGGVVVTKYGHATGHALPPACGDADAPPGRD